MATCQEGDGSCSVESDDESDSALEGRWLGVGFGLFFLLIFVAWFFRTISSRQRRLQLISKLNHCCKEKSPENGNLGRPDPSRRVGYPPERNDRLTRPKGLRDLPKSNGTNGGVIYYTPRSTQPPAFKKTITRAGSSVPSALDHFGHYHTENEKDSVDRAGSDPSHLAVHGRPRPRHRMKKSRSTVSMASCNLAPIQEVEDSADSDGVQKARPRVVESSRQGQLNSSLLGSKSHPDRLAYLGQDSDQGPKDPVTNTDQNEGGGTMEQRPRDASRKDGTVHVNFVHGSDDDDSLFESSSHL
ncbi:hypothetical protein RRG08_010421 [Elysia crispata]|uniref:Uncharacterized protein n=1 Tax=Elysia crispata TaxID=231223 RepID=A0AAE0YRN7_9GAST|nr:hypothetical protein RRG08_010421 [Elysia crispata]